MSLEIVAYNPILITGYPYFNADNNAASLWDDDIGLCVSGYKGLSSSSFDATRVYAIGQLDGSADIRNNVISLVSCGIDLSKPKSFFTGIQDTSGNILHRYYYEYDPRLPNFKYTNGAATQYRSTYFPLPTGIWTSLDMVAITETDYVFVGQQGSVSLTPWILTFPRDPAAPQVWAFRLQFDAVVSSSIAYHAGPISPSDFPGKVWFNYQTKRYDFNSLFRTVQVVALLDLTTWTFSTTHVLHNMDDSGNLLHSGDQQTSFKGWGSVWYSRKYKVFVANFGNGLYVFDQQTVPKAMPNPPVVTPNSTATGGAFTPINPEPGGSTEISIVSIKRSNPAIIEVGSSLSAWMTANGLVNGSYVYIDGGNFGGFENYDQRLMDQYSNSYHVYGQHRIDTAALPITVIDDTHFSVPVDGDVAADVSPCYIYGGHTENSTVPAGECGIYANNITYPVGAKITLFGFDSGHPINGQFTVIGVSGFVSFIDFDYDAHTALTNHSGFHTPGWSGAASVPPTATKAVATSFHASIINYDATVNPPTITVDNPAWLDKLAIGAGGTFRVIFRPHDFGWLPYYSSDSDGGYACTRISANRFALGADPDLLYQNTSIGWEFQSQLHPKIVLNNYDLQVGDTLLFKDIPDYPALNGTIAHILSIVTPGDNEYVIDIDTTGMPAWPWNYYDQVTVIRKLTSIWGKITFLGAGGAGAYPPIYYSGKGIATYVDIIDDFHLPAPGIPVVWSATGGGAFSPPISLTDSNGRASTYYIAPKTFSGNSNITATVNWS